MEVTGERMMFYRFGATSAQNGPRTLKWITDTYGSTSDCLVASSSDAEIASAWQPIAALVTAVANAPAMADQRKNLERAKLAFSDSTTIAEAEILLSNHRGSKPPTALKLKRLNELGLSAPPGATRGIVDELIRRAQLDAEGVMLANRGLALPEGAVSAASLYQLRDAVDSLEFAIGQARSRGLDFSPSLPLALQDMAILTKSLERFWQAAGDLRDVWLNLKEHGTLDSLPTHTQQTAILSALFAEIRNGKWTESDHDFERLALAAMRL
jgi:hypothetical protein